MVFVSRVGCTLFQSQMLKPFPQAVDRQIALFSSRVGREVPKLVYSARPCRLIIRDGQFQEAPIIKSKSPDVIDYKMTNISAKVISKLSGLQDLPFDEYTTYITLFLIFIRG